MTDEGSRPGRCTAKIRLDPFQIQRLLGLPEGMHVVAVDKQFDPIALVFLVESDTLDPVPPHAESPYLDGHTEVVEVETDGRWYHRTEWRTGAVLRR